MFERAFRIKLRFTTDKGKLSTEDLWDLGLKDLNKIAMGLNKKINETTVSFIGESNSSSDTDTLAFNIVKYIINYKLAYAKSVEDAANKAAMREKLAQLIEKKELESLESKSIDELKAMMGGV